MGLDPTTFAVDSVAAREATLGARLAHAHKLKFDVSEARRRQRARAFYQPRQQQRLQAHQGQHAADQLVAAVTANDAELTVALARKGAPLHAETEGEKNQEGVRSCVVFFCCVVSRPWILRAPLFRTQVRAPKS